MTLLTSLSAALAAPQAKTGVAVLPTPDGAVLRWSLPNDATPAGGFVVRVTDTGRSVPVASPQPYSAGLGLTKAQYQGLTALYAAPPRSDDERVQRALMTLNVAVHPSFARALGILYTLNGLKPGTHTVTVAAVGRSGETPVGTATFTTGPTPTLPAPDQLTVSGAQPAPRLRWTPPDDRHAVVAYNVYRAAGPGPFVLLKPAPFFRSRGAGEAFEDAGLSPAVSYRYRVTSLDLFGRESAPSSPLTLNAQGRPTVDSPSIAQASVTGAQVQLRWAPIGNPKVQAIVVLRGTDPTRPLQVIARVPPGRGQYLDTTTVPGTPYIYALAAEDQAGLASARGPLTSVTAVNRTPPRPPAGLSVTPGESALTLRWTANAEPDLRGYLVFRSEGAQPGVGEVLLTSAPLQTPSYRDDIPQGVQTRYHYRVVAVNTSEVRSPPSAIVTAALVDHTPPPVPSLRPPQTAGGHLELQWLQADVPDLAHFELRRTAAGTAPVTVTLDAATRTYQDQQVTPGTVYTYVVLSIDAAGNRSDASTPVLASVGARTLAPPTGAATLLPDAHGVQVRWTAQAGTQTVVYRLQADGQPVQLSDPLDRATFDDLDGTPDSRYQLQAVSQAGALSPLSAAFKVSGP
ncbi:fibronectin type III domain-containing protein [Deinococcus sonorensis]|uniref:Fibronectin type III domain-containing protein n=1 Tax=Deinococcus sonorensis TaxID=309891 RepID=A0ABV8YB75_9DEIO